MGAHTHVTPCSPPPPPPLRPSQFMFLTLFAGVMFSVVRGLMSAGKDGSSSSGGASNGKKWDDL